jgi:uncharacterized protein
MRRLLYLHGFASSPQSRKARFFQEGFARLGVDLAVPNLLPGGLRGATLTSQLRVVADCAGTGPVSLIGSSLGGYLAALYAARHPEVERLVLLAPAFGFARLWSESLGEEKMRRWRDSGTFEVLDYSNGQTAEVGWKLMEDALTYEDEPAITQPCLIYHGAGDDVVPVQVSRAFARTRTCAELREVQSGHELLDALDEIWEGTAAWLMEGSGRDSR